MKRRRKTRLWFWSCLSPLPPISAGPWRILTTLNSYPYWVDDWSSHAHRWLHRFPAISQWLICSSEDHHRILDKLSCYSKLSQPIYCDQLVGTPSSVSNKVIAVPWYHPECQMQPAFVVQLGLRSVDWELRWIALALIWCFERWPLWPAIWSSILNWTSYPLLLMWNLISINPIC